MEIEIKNIEFAPGYELLIVYHESDDDKVYIQLEDGSPEPTKNSKYAYAAFEKSELKQFIKILSSFIEE
jgi:hypothetical protein